MVIDCGIGTVKWISGGGEGGCGCGWERSREVKEFSYEKAVTAKPGVGDTTTFTGDPPNLSEHKHE